jgi:hypothetical protein
VKAVIRRTAAPPASRLHWEDPAWCAAATLSIDRFRPEGTVHRPCVLARLLYDAHALHGLYRVEDRYVRCVTTGVQGPVWEDSCVELFLQPAGAAGYFNFEFNCGGAFLCHYREASSEGAVVTKKILSEAECARVAVYHSLPQIVDPEIADPITWLLGFSIPFALLEPYAGPIGDPMGKTWRGNLYKCADRTSHPHWASWAPVDQRNFHIPHCFGELAFIT